MDLVPAIIAFLIVLLLVGVNILFDTLGTSVTAADLAPINAMASKKVLGARQALYLVRNADTVANFCNDVVGDVSGAVTGAAGATVAIKISAAMQGSSFLEEGLSLLMIALVAGLTVGGKAAGKTFAITKATTVVVAAGRVISWAEQITGRSFTNARSSNTARRRNP